MTEVRHLDRAPENGRFVLLDDGAEIGEMTYTYAGKDKAVFDHTFIRPDRRGGNLGELLMDAAMDWVRETGLAIYPLCPYVDKMLRAFRTKYADVPRADFRIDELTGELQPCDFNPDK